MSVARRTKQNRDGQPPVEQTPEVVTPVAEVEDDYWNADISEPGDAQPRVPDPQDQSVAEPEGEEPEGEEPEGEEPEGEEPEGEEPEGEEPEGEQLESDEPERATPEGDELEREAPEVKAPEGDEPEGDEPNGDEPNGDEPKGEAPEREAPEGAVPVADIEEPAGEQGPAHGLNPDEPAPEPDTEEPDAEEPDTEEPDAEEPDTEEPDTEEQETEEPDTEEPDAVAGSQVKQEPGRAAAAGTDFDEFAAARGSDEGEQTPVAGKAAWLRLLRMSRPRATRANLLVALLAVLLGAGIAAQVQLTSQRGLDELSQSDLVRVLDDVSLRASRLDQQVRELEATRDRLKSGTGSTAEAMDQAQKRLDTLGILAGTIAAKGPGITVRISDPDRQVTGPIVLDLIQELRDAGAESIDVGGVRVVASSFVGDRDGEILVDGTAVTRPLVITVIGDSKTLSSAMTIPGGIVESVRQKGANATITESDQLEITSIHTPTDLKNAKPVE
jgi:uncharacterized protein YlxW (UPF0749 family)